MCPYIRTYIHPASLSNCSLPISVSLFLSLISSFSPAFQPVINCSFCALQNGGWAESSRWKWVPIHCTARAAEVPELPAGSGGGDGLVPEQSGGNRTLRPAGEAAVLCQMLRIQCVFWLQIAEPEIMCTVCKGCNGYFSVSVPLFFASEAFVCFLFLIP